MPAASIPASPLQIPDFRLYWLARFCAVMSNLGMVVIIGYQVYDVARADYGMSIKEASFQIGLIGLAQFLPLLLLTPLAGYAADRFERRTVARLANTADTGVALALGWLTMNAMLTLPLLFAMAALHGVARVFMAPATSAIAPNIVPAPLLPRAIAMSSIAWQSASVIGPTLGGFLYAANPAAPYWTAAALMVISILALSSIRPVVPPPMVRKASPFQQMADGLVYVGKHRFLFGSITLDLFAVLLGGATAMLPVYARDILNVGTEGLGLLRASTAFGAAVVALWFSWRPLKNNVGVKMLVAVAAFGACTVIFGLSNNLALSMAMLALLGAADMLSVYVRSSLIQLHTPDAMRGRVSAVSGLAISASNELGEMQSGVAAALIGPVSAVTFGGAAAIAVAAIWAYLFPELRRARTFAPPNEGLAQSAMEEKPA